MNAKLTILGCGSARPTFQNSPSGQVLELCDKSFLIDCGEGVQLSIARMGVRTSRLYNIFISHLHGDHCFGLIGLLSTLSMQHRLQPMHIYAHPDLERLMQPWLGYFGEEYSYDIVFHPINPRHREVIFEDRTVQVETIPLKHSVPCCGFLFSETHRVPDSMGGFVRETRKRYAYCSDTRYTESFVEQIKGVDLLYHESTFLNEHESLCKNVMHSTAAQAATVAAKAEAGQLLLGHYSARVDEHERFLHEAFPVFPRTLLAREGETIEF
ncbi:MAG: ribonuclease Z [Paludibacteraceae bacterium]|nr:ribonuclease Z [Paludibacteraceae bacterium]